MVDVKPRTTIPDVTLEDKENITDRYVGLVESKLGATPRCAICEVRRLTKNGVYTVFNIRERTRGYRLPIARLGYLQPNGHASNLGCT